MWKWMLGLFLFCVLLCAGSGYYVWTNKDIRKQIEQYMPGNKPTEVRLEKVIKGELTRTISAPGQIEPKTSVKISAQVSARIVALPFRENEVVKKGDVIVRLDSRDVAAQLDSARAALKGDEARLEGAQAALQQSQQERDRVRKLAATGDVAPSAVEQADANYLRAQSSLRAAEHAIEQARAQIVRAEKDLDNTTITSPMDGTITRLDAEVGELVVVGTLNNAGSVIMEIADLANMVLKARVDESNIVPVKENQLAKVFINAYGERVFNGVVERVELQRKVDRDNTGYFEVWVPIALDKGETLRSGLTANTDIMVETVRDVLVLPSQAVVDRKVDDLPKKVTDGNANINRANTYARVVYRVEDSDKTTNDGKKIKKVIATPVQIGTSDLTRTAIIAGLKEGDLVVTGPFKALQSLRHDQEVIEESAEKAAPVETPSGKPAEPATAAKS
ncbi:MAG: efflux RND transporter periplasmic adaptor subunit [Phycisphaerales bacterium]|nr:efflux RND transporter periplasmic adaptor subunit [Phycisphaerales bacterium]